MRFMGWTFFREKLGSLGEDIGSVCPIVFCFCTEVISCE
jgi:hypothetical protein